MNKRTIAIIKELAQQKTPVTIEGLSEQYKVSQRTIRNDLTAINNLLAQNDLASIELKNGGVISIPEEFNKILSYIGGTDFYLYKLSKEERKMIAAALLINSAGYITLSTIADTLFVSRATIISDLNEIKEFIKEGGLHVSSHPNKGLLVEGKESDKRWFLFRLSAFELGSYVSTEQSSAMVSILAGNKITIEKIIHEQEHVHKSFLSDSSFLKLEKYIGIMINRNLQGEYIEPQPMKESDKYMFAQDILKYIAQYCQISTTPDEVCYLSGLLEKCRYIKRENFDTNSVKVQMVTRQFIRKISEELGIHLENDYDCFENLSNHLESMFASEESQFPKNPVLDEIVEDNQEVLDTVKRSMYILEQHGNRKISEVEITYIAIHICAALERKKNSEIAFHVIVACHAGIGTSQLLMERLKKHFNFQIVDIVSSHEAAYLEPEKADFIITTVPLENCKLDYVVVSPILSDEDYIRVGNKIDALRNSRNLPSRIETREITAKGLIERLQPIIYEQVPDLAPALMRTIRKEIRKYFRQTQEAEEEIFAPYLHHLLTEKHIQIDVECTDWKDAIRSAALPLLKEGYIEERYIEAMIHNVEENGPYIVLSPGFAVPHEGLEMGSIQVGMNLIRLKTPVTFGAEEFDPVEFVCCLSAVDHKTHLKALFNLVNMLGKEEFKQALHMAKTSEEAAAIVEKYEYSIIK